MEEEIDLKELIKVFWKKKLIILITLLVFVLLGLVKIFVFDNLSKNDTIEKKYFSQSSIMIGKYEDSDTSLNRNVVSSQYGEFSISEDTIKTSNMTITDGVINTLNEIVKSNNVLSKVISELNLNYSVDYLASHVVISRAVDSSIIKIYVEADSEEQAININNKILEIFDKCLIESNYTNNVVVIDEANNFNASSVSEDDTILSSFVASFETTEDSRGTILKNVAIFAFIGLVLSCGYVLVIEMFDDTVKSIDEIEKKNNIKILNKFSPNIKEYSEEYSILNIKVKDNKKIAIVNARKNEADQAFSLNLAKSFAIQNKKVLVINFSENNDENKDSKYLVDYLNSKEKLNINDYILNTDEEKVSIMNFGNTQNNEIIDETKISKIIEKLEKDFDEIIVNSDNVLGNANSLLITKMINNVLVLVRNRKDKLDDIEVLKKSLEDFKVNIIGAAYIEE